MSSCTWSRWNFSPWVIQKCCVSSIVWGRKVFVSGTKNECSSTRTSCTKCSLHKTFVIIKLLSMTSFPITKVVFKSFTSVDTPFIGAHRRRLSRRSHQQNIRARGKTVNLVRKNSYLWWSWRGYTHGACLPSLFRVDWLPNGWGFLASRVGLLKSLCQSLFHL